MCVWSPLKVISETPLLSHTSLDWVGSASEGRQPSFSEIIWGEESHSEVLRTYSKLCLQASRLSGLQGPFADLGSEQVLEAYIIPCTISPPTPWKNSLLEAAEYFCSLNTHSAECSWRLKSWTSSSPWKVAGNNHASSVYRHHNWHKNVLCFAPLCTPPYVFHPYFIIWAFFLRGTTCGYILSIIQNHQRATLEMKKKNKTFRKMFP